MSEHDDLVQLVETHLDNDPLTKTAKELFMASPFQVCRTSELEAEWAALEPDVRRIWYDSAAQRLLGAGNLQDIATRYEEYRKAAVRLEFRFALVFFAVLVVIAVLYATIVGRP